MNAHHEVWLKEHPERTVEWFEAIIKSGFDVHHLDGDHENNDPLNLVLIENRDHLMVHSGGRPRLGRLHAKSRKGRCVQCYDPSKATWIRIDRRTGEEKVKRGGGPWKGVKAVGLYSDYGVVNAGKNR